MNINSKQCMFYFILFRLKQKQMYFKYEIVTKKFFFIQKNKIFLKSTQKISLDFRFGTKNIFTYVIVIHKLYQIIIQTEDSICLISYIIFIIKYYIKLYGA